MIVVDTTVWIDFFNGAGTPEDRHLQQLITAGRSLALADLIFCEILQGIRKDADFDAIARVAPLRIYHRPGGRDHTG